MREQRLQYQSYATGLPPKLPIILVALAAACAGLVFLWCLGHEAYIEDRLTRVRIVDTPIDPQKEASIEATCGLNREHTMHLLLVSGLSSIALVVQAIRLGNRGVALPRMD
jgi:hypothetical protein